MSSDRGASPIELVLVAAVAANGVIGADGALPWHLPDDLARFKRLTFGHPVIMGRKTFESIGRALPGRTSIVVTRAASVELADRAVALPADTHLCLAADPDAALEVASTVGVGPVFVIGGGEIYAAYAGAATRLEITHVDRVVDGDAWFPPIDAERWEAVASEPVGEATYVTYRRRD